MTTGKKIWGILYIVGIIGVIIFFISQPSDDEICIQQYKKEKGIYYNGRVVAKYLDKANHNSKTLELSMKGEKVNLDWDLSGLYEFVEVNDSIVKDTGNYEVRIYRDSDEYKFIIDYGCDNLKGKMEKK